MVMMMNSAEMSWIRSVLTSFLNRHQCADVADALLICTMCIIAYSVFSLFAFYNCRANIEFRVARFSGGSRIWRGEVRSFSSPFLPSPFLPSHSPSLSLPTFTPFPFPPSPPSLPIHIPSQSISLPSLPSP